MTGAPVPHALQFEPLDTSVLFHSKTMQRPVTRPKASGPSAAGYVCVFGAGPGLGLGLGLGL